MPFDIQSYLNAHKRYLGYRDAAYDLTWNQMAPKVPDCDLRLLPFDSAALAFWQAMRTWSNLSPLFSPINPRGKFNWEAIYEQLYTTPRRFDISIWDGTILVGLAVGKASRGPENVTLKWMERFEIAGNSMKGRFAEIVLTAAEHYAKILGKQYVMVRHPLPGTEALYEGLGFSLAPRRFGVPYYKRPVA